MTIQIHDEIEEIKKMTQAEQSVAYVQHESKELNKLFEALAKAQEEMEIAKTDTANPFFKSKYADLPSVVKASRPYLSKNGLSVMQITRLIDKNEVLLTRLCHSSGQWVESQMLIKPLKPDPQTYGSTITYLKRYAYSALVGVVASGEDDDGEIAMKPVRENSDELKGAEKISKTMRQILSQQLEGHPDILESILNGYKINKLSDLQDKYYTKVIERILEVKRAKES